MLKHRPYPSQSELSGLSDEIWTGLSGSDWKEAFGLRTRLALPKGPEIVLRSIKKAIKWYESLFGYGFVLHAPDASGPELLRKLNERLQNAPEVELEMAMREQSKITRARLSALFDKI